MGSMSRWSREVMSTDAESADFTFESRSIADTVQFGHCLGGVLLPATLVALEGTLGAGKTRLVQAVAESLGVNAGDVVSPTFVLVQQYEGRRTLYHVDVYRLKDEDEYLELGIDECLTGNTIVFIEWAGRVENCLPRERIQISIDVTGEDTRRFHVTAVGEIYKDVIRALAGNCLPGA